MSNLQALVAALHFLTKDIDLSGCGPHCELVPSEYAYNFWDLAEVGEHAARKGLLPMLWLAG